MFTGPVGPVEVIFYWPEAVFGNFYWPGAICLLLALSPALACKTLRLKQIIKIRIIFFFNCFFKNLHHKKHFLFRQLFTCTIQGRIQGGCEGFVRTPPPWLVSHFVPPRHLWTNIKTNCFSCLGHQLQFAILSTSFVFPGPE